jgi:hypothetical protein
MHCSNLMQCLSHPRRCPTSPLTSTTLCPHPTPLSYPCVIFHFSKNHVLSLICVLGLICAIHLGSKLPATICDDRKWMYDGRKKNGAHSREWVDKTNKFIEHAFSLSNTGIIRCPCNKCRNGWSHKKKNVSIHICRFGYISGYEVWVHHGEEVPETKPVEEDDCNILPSNPCNHELVMV